MSGPIRPDSLDRTLVPTHDLDLRTRKGREAHAYRLVDTMPDGFPAQALSNVRLCAAFRRLVAFGSLANARDEVVWPLVKYRRGVVGVFTPAIAAEASPALEAVDDRAAPICSADERWARLMAAGKVRWLPGMLVRADGESETLRLVAELMPRVWYARAGAATRPWADNLGVNAQPVWSDAATVGCLWDLAREGTGDCSLYLQASVGATGNGMGGAHGYYAVWRRDGVMQETWTHPDRASALLATLEAQ